MGTVVELSIGWMTLTITSNEMTRSTKSIDICLILFFLVVTMKNKSGRVKQKEEKKKNLSSAYSPESLLFGMTSYQVYQKVITFTDKVSSKVIGDFTFKVSYGRPVCMALLEATDVAPTCTLAAAVMQFSFHLQPFTFSQGMENVPLEGLPFKLSIY